MSAQAPRKRLLVAYSNASVFTNTTREYLDSFRKHSSFEVEYLHVTHGAVPMCRLDDYDAVLLNYCARLCFDGYVSPSFQDALAVYRGAKAIAVQDEYDRTETLQSSIERLGIDLVFTCVPDRHREYVYPASRFPNTTFVQVLTGYMPSHDLDGQSVVPLAQRPIHIGYRGRRIHSRYGRLGRQKYEIGLKMRRACESRGIEHDILMNESDRIHGKAWYQWLGRCRCVLGTESGSNVFDFNGTIETEMELARSEDRPVSREIELLVRQRDVAVDMGQISPRVFEAATCRTPMILLEGRYSGILEPDVHYLELASDYSNIESVLDRTLDTAFLERLSDRVWTDLVESRLFNYEAFVGLVDRELGAVRQASQGNSLHARGRDRKNNVTATTPPNVSSVLLEQPTPEPRTMADFWEIQRHLAGLAAARRLHLLRPASALPSPVRRLLAPIFLFLVGRPVVWLWVRMLPPVGRMLRRVPPLHRAACRVLAFLRSA